MPESQSQWVFRLQKPRLLPRWASITGISAHELCHIVAVYKRTIILNLCFAVNSEPATP